MLLLAAVALLCESTDAFKLIQMHHQIVLALTYRMCERSVSWYITYIIYASLKMNKYTYNYVELT